MATYGEGDPTDNAMEFYDWLQNGDADLSGLNYAVSGFSIIFFCNKWNLHCHYFKKILFNVEKVNIKIYFMDLLSSLLTCIAFFVV